MVLKNQLWNDARVKKEAITLAGTGLKVTILCQPEEGVPRSEEWGKISVLRIHRSGKFKAAFREALDSAGDTADTEKKNFTTGFVSTLRRNPVKRFLGDLLHSTLYQARLLYHALLTGADVYHAHDLDTLSVCAAAAWLTGTSYIYDSHELWLESNRHLAEPSRFVQLMDELTEKSLITGAAAVIAVTPGRASVMRSMYRRMVEPILVANYPPVADPYPCDIETRISLGALDESCFLFLYQGVLAPKRGLEQLIDAALMLRGLQIHVAIVGHDVSGNTIRTYAEEKSAEDMVTFHPPVPSEKLHEITGSADAGLLLFQDSCLNHNLSLPNKLFEYMMSGLPVLACSLPEISEVIVRHDCGCLIDASDPVSIADGMRKMAADKKEAAKQGKRGYKAARSMYTWDNSAEVLKELYRNVLQ